LSVLDYTWGMLNFVIMKKEIDFHWKVKQDIKLMPWKQGKNVYKLKCLLSNPFGRSFIN
jgi:hypothetical protein